VHFEHLGDAPAGGDDGWDGHVDLRVECPSGTIYIDQPSALAIDLKDALAAGAGTYAARIAWRGREAGEGHEEYLVRTWRTGPVSDETIAGLESDKDSGQRRSGKALWWLSRGVLLGYRKAEFRY
jgi:hypothetical protein